MDDYRLSSSYNSGWKPIRQEKKEIRKFNNEYNKESTSLVNNQKSLLDNEGLYPLSNQTIDALNQMQAEILAKLNQLQMEVLSLKQLIKEMQITNLEVRASEGKPYANKPNRFFK